MTRYLVDTHALIWWWLGDPNLSAKAQAAIEDGEILVSPISAYEIANKYRLGKLPHGQLLLETFEASTSIDSFVPLPVNAHHARTAGLLDGRHRDPFDRILAAQALAEGVELVTCDKAFAAFGCRVLW